MKRILHHVSWLAVVMTTLSLTSSLAHGQATLTPTNISPNAALTLLSTQSQEIRVGVSWAGMPQGQSIPIDVFCEIKNTSAQRPGTTGKVKLVTYYTYSQASGSTFGIIQSPGLITPAGITGDPGKVIITLSSPGVPDGVGTTTPTYK